MTIRIDSGHIFVQKSRRISTIRRWNDDFARLGPRLKSARFFG